MPAILVAELVGAIEQAGLSTSDTVLHWHNHSLGKNAAFPAVIRRLADRGFRQLLQIHDFAEDYRPENYAHLISALGAKDPAEFARACYPNRPSIHYATLTRADGAVLESLGILTSRIHFLPNCVTLGADEMPSPGRIAFPCSLSRSVARRGELVFVSDSRDSPKKCR